MKKLIATLAMMASVSANADAMLGFDMQLVEDNKRGDGSVNAYAMCGKAAVGLSDVVFRNDVAVNNGNSALMIVHRDTKQVEGIKDQLSDYNKFACFTTPKGYRIVIGSICSGSACGDAFNYYVFDVNTMKTLNKKAVQEVKDLDRLLNGNK